MDALITLRGVSRRYATPAGEFTALSGIDLEIGTGEFVALRGKSGTGKSTLLDLIAGIDRPSDGEVVVAGRPFTRSENALARGAGAPSASCSSSSSCCRHSRRRRTSCCRWTSRRRPPRARRPGRSGSWSAGCRRSGRQAAGDALGRAAAARGHRPRARQRPGVGARRRAHRQPGLATAVEVLELFAGCGARDHRGDGDARARHAGRQPRARARDGRLVQGGADAARKPGGTPSLPATGRRRCATSGSSDAQRLRGARDRDRDRGLRDGALELRDPGPRAEPGLSRHKPGLGRTAHGQGRRRAARAVKKLPGSATPRPGASCAGGSRPGPRNGAA